MRKDGKMFKFTNSFIKKIERYPSDFDSVWLITTSNGPIVLVRDYEETFKSLSQLLTPVKSINEIKNLDKRTPIFYD